MAIPFARATPVRITVTSDLSRFIAYVARTAIRAAERRKIYDYKHLNDDLVHQEVLLPLGAPDDLRSCGVFANSLDLAELRKMRTPPARRKRQVQVAVTVIVALPPASEVALHEAAEILRRVVLAARVPQDLAIHLAIHRKSINVHGHATYALRPIHADGTWGLKIRDQFIRLRQSQYQASTAHVAEGFDWQDLSRQIHQAFFVERGIDLVVDPAAPQPEEHIRPFEFANGEFHNDASRQQIEQQRRDLHDTNVEIIRGSPTWLIEALLKGRASLQIDELHRLCTRFIDNEVQRQAEVDRILLDQNIVCLAEGTEAQKPRHATTRRTMRLVRHAVDLVENATTKVRAITGPDHEAVVALMVEWADEQDMFERPLILGLTLSDCENSRNALAALEPLTGTIEMAATAPGAERKGSKKRNICLTPGRTVIVPHAEKIDDRRLARLILAVDRGGARLILGHDQSYARGLVRDHLAAYIVDRSIKSLPLIKGGDNAHVIVRMLRAGLLQQAILTMIDHDLVIFGERSPEWHDDAPHLVVCDDPRRISAATKAARAEFVRAGLIDEPQTVVTATGNMTFSLGEWVVATATRGLPPGLEAHQLGQVVAIDIDNDWLDVVRQGEVSRLDLMHGPAIRPAAAVSIRDAWDAPDDTNLAIEVSDPRRVWSVLLLAANRIGRTQLFVEPTLARNAAELVDAARRSIPGSLHHRVVRSDVGTKRSRRSFEVAEFPEYTPPQPNLVDATDANVGRKSFEVVNVAERAPPQANRVPLLANFDEEVRRRLTRRAETYDLLREFVAAGSPNQEINVERALQYCQSGVSAVLIRSIAGRIQQEQDQGDLGAMDLPFELRGLEPERYSEIELWRFEQDLEYLSAPYFGPLWRPGPRSLSFAEMLDRYVQQDPG
jgi:MobA/MobL family